MSGADNPWANTPCPICKRFTLGNHCESGRCGWFRCTVTICRCFGTSTERFVDARTR